MSINANNTTTFYDSKSLIILSFVILTTIFSTNAQTVKHPTAKEISNITLIDFSGELIKLGNIKSKVTILYVWSCQCEYCHEHLPALKSIYQLYSRKQLEIIGISIDSISKTYNDSINSAHLPWKLTNDGKGITSSLIKSLSISQIPTFIILDKHKKIAGVTQDEQLLLKIINQMMR